MAELIVVAAWHMLWQQRRFMEDEAIQSHDRVAISIKVLATNFVSAATPKQIVQNRDHMSKRPNQGCVKVNVEASVQSEMLTGTTGVVRAMTEITF